jgi:hypothetical protein
MFFSSIEPVRFPTCLPEDERQSLVLNSSASPPIRAEFAKRAILAFGLQLKLPRHQCSLLAQNLRVLKWIFENRSVAARVSCHQW